jgi:hypothetical protein
MASIGVSAIKLIDSDGDALDDGDGKLNVNATLVAGATATLGTTTYSETSTKGNVIGVVRNNTLAALASTDNEIAPLQVDGDGALYVVQAGTVTLETTAGTTNAFNVGAGGVAASQRGIATLVRMNDVVSAPAGHSDNEWTFLQTDLNGSLYTTHGITGAVSSKNTSVGTSIEDLHGVSDVACKRIDMMASPDNTGYIWVGGTSTTVGTGIRLAPGDFYSVDIDNTDDIQVIASVDTEDISYTIFT